MASQVTQQMPTSKGSFVAQLTGYAANSTPTIQWRKTGNKVLLTCNAGSIAVSTVNTMTITNIPVAIQVKQTYSVICRVQDAGVNGFGILGVTPGAVFSFGNGILGTVFTAAGNKGLPGNWSVEYDVS